MNQHQIIDRSWTPTELRPQLFPTPSFGGSMIEENRDMFDAVLREQSLRALDAFARALQTEQQVAQANQHIEIAQKPVYQLLRTVTQQGFPDDPIKWADWWQDYNDRTTPPPRTLVYYEDHPVVQYVPYWVPHSCFAAGTLVRTQFGLEPIETIQIGDRVLSQSIDTGELNYKVVLLTTVRPVTDHCQFQLGDDEIICTWGHPFWLNKEGWRMARHLQAGDCIQTVKGPRRIDRIGPAKSQPAYNLVVEDFHSYFVGRCGILAHDNTDRRPTRAWAPGFLREQTATDPTHR